MRQPDWATFCQLAFRSNFHDDHDDYDDHDHDDDHDDGQDDQGKTCALVSQFILQIKNACKHVNVCNMYTIFKAECSDAKSAAEFDE